MAGEVKRLKVTCVARNAAKANFLTTVSGNVTVRAQATHTLARLDRTSFYRRSTPLSPSLTRTRRDAHAQVKQARAEIQKIFEKMASSQVTLISCAAP